MERMKKGRKYFHSKKNEFNKDFDNSKVQCFYCHKKGNYARECHEKKNNQGKFHASTTIEEDKATQKKSSEEKDGDYRKEYFP